VEEVNFWQPGGNHQFRALEPGELFLFKLHSPRNFIVGGGFFAHSTLLPVSLAWEAFALGNGARSLREMRGQIQRYRKVSEISHDYRIGCIVLTQPFFFDESRWIPAPVDWKPNLVKGRRYDLTVEPGRSLFASVQERLPPRYPPATEAIPDALRERYGAPVLMQPRLGQGAFRVIVTDAYERRCAVTGERVLPVLEAAHIRDYAEGGGHQVENGLLLRSDLHALFDRGYVTVTPSARLVVSSRIRQEFENGRDYYALDGKPIRLPVRPAQRPSPENLGWHNDNRFLG
jgi:putative restriction endonuclease